MRRVVEVEAPPGSLYESLAVEIGLDRLKDSDFLLFRQPPRETYQGNGRGIPSGHRKMDRAETY